MLSAMGFAQLCPAYEAYFINTPHIKSARLNGKNIPAAYLTYGQITSGGVFELELSKEPCPDFCKEVPESFMK